MAVGVLLALVLWLWPPGWRIAAPALSPFLAVCGPLVVRSLGLASLLALPMIALALVRRRFWCRRLCPVGLISESCGRIRGTRAAATRKTARSSPYWPAARFLALATLGGAFLGYPLFLWMDPLALFGGFFNITRILRPEIPALSAAALPLMMLISYLFPGSWCAKLCPLGAAQDLLALARLRRKGGARRMPARAVARGRRAFLALGAGTAFSAAVPLSWARKTPPLRPPGSVNETAFQGGCIRCGSCSRICPTGIIQPAVAWGEVAGLLAPRLRFTGPSYCLQDCNRCGQVCPSGVIRPLPLEEKNRRVIGVARVNLAACLLTLEIECGICVPRCPRAAIVDTFSYEAYKVVVKVERDKCNGCGACVGICPPKVITVEPV